MAAPTHHWLLGLFVASGAALALATVAVLSVRSMRQEVGMYVSYFDESVQGLEVGSPIKFRGVTVGTVNAIEVAPDHRHVEVEAALSVQQLTRLGLDIAETPAALGAPRKLQLTPDLRMELASAGLTGVKFLQLDFFDEKAYPPPELPFDVPENYVPSKPSMIKSLELSLTGVAGHLPEIVQQASTILGEVDGLVKQVRERNLPERVSATADGLDALLLQARHKVSVFDVGSILRMTVRTLADADAVMLRLESVLVRLDRPDGVLERAEQVTGQLGDTLRGADTVGDELAEALRQVQASARSLRGLTTALGQDPDMLLKGPTPESP